MNKNVMSDAAMSYVRGYNDGVNDAIKMINACSESLTAMLAGAREKFKEAGIDLDAILEEGK